MTRTYLISGNPGEEVKFVDWFRTDCNWTPTANEVECRQMPGDSPGDYQKILFLTDLQAADAELGSMRSSFQLSHPWPQLKLENSFNPPTGLTVLYEAIIHLPFEIDHRTQDYSVNLSHHLDVSRRIIQIPAREIPPDERLNLVLSIKSARRLPVLDTLARDNQNKLVGTAVVVVAHLLDDFPPLAEAMIKAGVEADDLYIIGIPYSSQATVVQTLRSLGFGHLHVPSEYPFEGEIVSAIRWVNECLLSAQDKGLSFRWLVIEDGGYIVPAVHKLTSEFTAEQLAELRSRCLGGVEQTRNGIWAYQREVAWYDREIPVCSVADSTLKSELESIWIGEAVARNVKDLLKQTGLDFKSGDPALVIGGGGATGRRIASALATADWDVSVLDKKVVSRCIARADKRIKVLRSITYEEAVKNKRLIVGATGKDDILGFKEFRAMHPGTVVVNASSKRKEIKWADLKKFEKPQQRGPSLVYHMDDRYTDGHPIYILAGVPRFCVSSG